MSKVNIDLMLDEVMVGMGRRATVVSSALIAKPQADASSFLAMAMTPDGAVIPLELQRGAAMALLAGLAEHLSN